jgi:hypothetical protein
MMHSCGKHHYGNQTVVRQCCVDHCSQMARLAVDKAMTDQHPAYREYIETYNTLTDAEVSLVPDVYYAGANLGVIERPKT